MSLKSLKSVFASLVLSSLVLPGAALAQELVWNSVKAFGGGDGLRCNLNPADPASANVYWSSAGGDLSLIFTTFGLNLPKSTRFGGMLAFSTSCNVEASVTIPQGYFIRTLSQSLTVGIIKDPGTTGAISTNGFLFQTQVPLNQINMILEAAQGVNNVLFTRDNTQIFNDIERAIQCALTTAGPLTTSFKFQMLGVAARPLPFLGVLANLDGSDLNFGLAPSLESCPNPF